MRDGEEECVCLVRSRPPDGLAGILWNQWEEASQEARKAVPAKGIRIPTSGG